MTYPQKLSDLNSADGWLLKAERETEFKVVHVLFGKVEATVFVAYFETELLIQFRVLRNCHLRAGCEIVRVTFSSAFPAIFLFEASLSPYLNFAMRPRRDFARATPVARRLETLDGGLLPGDLIR